MRSSPRSALNALLVAAAAMSPVLSSAANVTRLDNLTTLNLAGAWSTGATVGTTDVAVFTGAYNTAGALSTAFGANSLSWGGIRVEALSGTAAGIVYVGGASATSVAGSAITLGSSGIDMSTASHDLVVNAATINLNTSQTFNIASGRNLRFGSNGGGAGNANVDGNSSAAVITISGSGVFDANQGGASGYADAAGYAGFAGKWVVNSGATLRGIRNGATAWGSNTAADAILLNGGTLAAGGISGSQGNWTWNTKMTLADGTASTIDNQLFSGSARYLKLESVIAGGASNTGTLTIRSTSTAVMSSDEYGFVIAGANTFAGALTIGASTYVRIGGSAAGTLNANVGNNGSLAAASIANSGVLRFTRNDAWTLASNLSGTGQIKVGSTVAAFGLGSTTSQVVTLSGALSGSGTLFVHNGAATITGNNTRSGGNELQGGTLTVSNLDNAGGVGGAGTGYVAIKSGSTLTYSGTSVTTTRNLFMDNGAATINVSDANAVLTWNDAVLKGGASGGLITKAGAGTLALGGAISSGGTTNVAVTGGTLVLSGANTYTGGTALSAGATLEVAGTGSLAATAITGAGALRKSGTGTLTLSSTSNAFTGGTSVTNGTLALGAAGVLADTGAVTVSGGTFDLGGFAETVGTVTLSGGTIQNGTLTSNANYAVSGGTIASTAILSGSVGLTKTGAGSATVNGVQAYTGATIVSNGTLSLGAFASLASSSIVIGDGATLETVDGLTLGAGRTLSLGSGSTVATANKTGTLTFDGGILNIDFGVSTNDLIAVSGDVTINSGSVAFSKAGAYTGGTFDILSYGGILSGDPLTLTLSGLSSDGTSRQTFNLIHEEVAKKLQLVVGGQAENVRWSGATDGIWAAGGGAAAGNWAVTDAGYTGDQPGRFFNGDTVVFDDTATTGTVTTDLVDVTPGSVTVSAETLDYTIGGVGVIASGALTKSGAATLTLTGANTFSGGTTLSAGRLRLGANNALGSGDIAISGGALSSDGATARSLSNAVALSGDATLGDATDTGELTLSGTVDLGAATRTLTAASNAVLSGVISNGGLVKSGSGKLTLSGANTYTGGTTVSQGTLELAASNVLANAGAVTVSGGTLAIGANSDTIGALTLTSGSLTGTGTLTVASATFDHSGSQAVGAVIAGSGSLTKAGNGTLTLSAANTFSGGTLLRSGAIVVSGASALGGSGVVTVNDASTGTSAASLLIDASVADGTIARAINVANEGSGAVTIGTLFNRAGGFATFSGALTLGRDVALTGGAAAGDRTQFTGGISGAGGVTIAGTTRVLFGTAANTYTGSTTVSSGAILQLSDGTGTANSLLADGATLTVNGTLSLAKNGNNETVGGLSGSGTVQALAGSDTLTVSSASDSTFSGTLRSNGGTLNLAKAGAGTLTLSGSNATVHTGTTTVNAGRLVFSNAVTLTGLTTVAGILELGASSNIGSGLTGAGEVVFGTGTLTIGNATGGNQFFTGKLTGTGTLALRGASTTIVNADGTSPGTSNFQIWTAATAVVQPTTAQLFALDTGASATDRKDFAFINDTGDALVLSGLSGWGALRNDAGSPASVRQIIVDQAGDSVFNGAVVSHRSGAGAVRSMTLTKRGNGTLELAGFVGKQTASSQAGASATNLAVEAGVLSVTNALNTTTTNTDAIRLATVTVTGGTLGFSAQALVNTAGNLGASSILLNGGTLRWLAGNTQDGSLGGRLQLASGKDAKLDVGANDVTLSAAFGGSTGGSLTKLGNGTLTLSAANTFTGGTTVSAGKLVAGNASALGSGDILLSAGILDFNNLDVLNRVIFAGGTLINVRSDGAVALGGSLTAEQINALDIPAIAAPAGTTLDLTGITKNVLVTGTATLTGLSTYTGALAVSGGTLDLSDGSNRPAAAIELRAGGTLDFGSTEFAGNVTYKGGAVSGAFVGNLNVSGAVSITTANVPSGKVVVTTGNSVGLASGFGGTVRLEGGSVTSGIDTYLGNLELGTGGSLNLTENPVVGGDVLVDNGGVLRGTGSVGNLTIASGGLLAPGNSPGLTTVTGSLYLQGGGAFDLEILATGGGVIDPVVGGDYDSVTIGGDLDLTGLTLENRFLINVISLLDPTTPGQVGDFDPSLTKVYDVYAYTGDLLKTYGGSATDLFQLDTTEFTFEGAALDPLLFSLVHNTVDKKIQLVYAPIPEPSTYGLILGGLALAGAAIRRRKKAAK